MTQIRIGSDIGIDLDQIVAWKKQNLKGGGKILNLSLANAQNGFGFSISSNTIGDQAFTRLHKLLLDRFAIDLGDDNGIFDEENEDDIDCDLVDDLEDLPS